jgi:hypothetical protein
MTQLRLREDAVPWREVTGEVLALDIGSSSYLSANPAGTLLWKMLATGTTREELIRRLVEKFGIDVPRAGEDVDLFLRELDARDLLDVSPPARTD